VHTKQERTPRTRARAKLSWY